MLLPNYVHDSVPVGKDQTNNVIIRTHGTIKKFDDLKTYSIKNRLGMFNSEKGFLQNGMEDELDIKDRINALKQMDILIELNSPTKDEVE